MPEENEFDKIENNGELKRNNIFQYALEGFYSLSEENKKNIKDALKK